MTNETTNGVRGGAASLGAAEASFQSPLPRTGRNGRPILTLRLGGTCDLHDAEGGDRAGPRPALNHDIHTRARETAEPA
jgi:hypothetical protein